MNRKPLLILVILALSGLAVVAAIQSFTGGPEASDRPGGAGRAVAPEQPEHPGLPPLPGPGERVAGTLAGRVEGEDGRPVAGAAVIVTGRTPAGESLRDIRLRVGGGPAEAVYETSTEGSWADLAAAETGPDGRFSVEVAAEGPFVVTAEAPGYARARVGDVASGTLDLVLRLPFAGSVTGRVVEPTGEPVPFAYIRTDDGECSTSCLADGTFKLHGVGAAEEVLVVASAEGFEDAPGRVAVGPGAVVELPEDLVLQPLPGLTGRVLDPEGQPLAGAPVQAMTSLFDAESETTDHGGRYFFKDGELAAGERTFRYDHPEYLMQEVKGVRIEGGRRQVLPDVTLQPGGEIAGVVTGPDGQPIAGARFYTIPDDRPFGFEMLMPYAMGRAVQPQTDDDGHYRSAGLKDATYLLVVIKDGYRAFRKEKIPVTVPQRTEVDVILDRGASVRGKVLGPGGAGVAGARVTADLQVAPANALEGLMMEAWESTAVSGADGSFTLTGFGEQKAELTATLEGFVPATAEDVAPGAEDVVLRLRRTGVVTGVVLDAETQEPVGGASVTIDDPLSGGVSSGEDGSFRVEGVAPGVHDLTARAENYVQTEVAGVEVKADGETTGIVVRLGRGISARVLVLHGVTGRPIANATVSFSGDVHQSADTGPDGRCEVAGLAPGGYEVSVRAPGLAKATEKGVQVPGDGDLEFRLTTGGSIRGIVRDAEGRPDAGQMVLLGGGGDFGQETSQTDDQGRFAFEHVAPGTWVVMLFGRGFDSGAGFNAQTRTVTVVEGETASVEFGGGGSERAHVTGRLMDRGQPQAGRMIILVKSDAEGGMAGMLGGFKMITTDSEGRFDIPDLARGTYRVVTGMMGSNQIGGSSEIVIDEGGEVEQDIEAPAGRLTGRVVRAADGEPIHRAKIVLLDPARALQPVGTVGEILAMLKGQAETDPKGRFEFPNASEGRALLQVAADGYAPRVMEEVDITAQGGELELRLDPGHQVEVAVRGPEGRPMADAAVVLQDARGRRIVAIDDFDLATDGTGKATLHLENGAYRLIVQAENFAPSRRDLTVRGPVKVEIPVALGGELRVLATAGGVALEGVKIRTFADGGEIAPQVTQATMMIGFPSRRTDAQGRLSIAHLPAGDLRVLAEAPDGRRAEAEVRMLNGGIADVTLSLE